MAATLRDLASYILGLLVLATFFSAWGPRTGYGYATEKLKGTVNHAQDDEPGMAVGVGNRGPHEATDSWTNWARDKLTEGLGHRHENAKMAARQMMDVAGDIAMKTKDKMSDVASGVADMTSQKAGEAKDAMMDKAGEAKDAMMDKAVDAKDAMMDKAVDAKETLMNKAGCASGAMADGAYQAADTASRAYEGAKQNLGEAYETARDTMSGNAKAKYEAAKEKVSQTTSDMGAKMNENIGEL